MITVLIPAYREVGRIGVTVSAAREVEGVGEVLVVDDGSPDATAKEAEASGARVLRLGRNGGKGRALGVGIEAASGDVVVLVDADLGGSARSLLTLVAPVTRGEADLTIAVLPSGGSGAGMGMARRLAAGGIQRATGFRARAPLSGQRAARREVFRRLLPFARGWGVEVGMTVDALRAGLVVREVDCPFSHRVTTASARDTLHRLEQFRDIAWALARRR